MKRKASGSLEVLGKLGILATKAWWGTKSVHFQPFLVSTECQLESAPPRVTYVWPLFDQLKA